MHSIRSTQQLERFLSYVLRIFRDSLPQAHIEQRWGQEALHLALNCSSRHYAGRSLQIFRALQVSLTCRDLAEIVSRLESTVGENDENMQGYVTEILLTLEQAVDHLDVDVRPLVKGFFKSTPNLNKDSAVSMRKSATMSSTPPPHSALTADVIAQHHIRSTSCNYGNVTPRKLVAPSPPIVERGEKSLLYF